MKRIFALVASLVLVCSAAAAPTGHTTLYSGSLYDRETGELRLNLQAGYTYTYDGSCDIDCSDLDFALYRWVPATNSRRGYWKFVVADRGSDDSPWVRVAPPANAQYRLDIVMARCALEPCGYEVEVY